MITSQKVNWKTIYKAQFSNNIILKDKIEKKKIKLLDGEIKKQNNIQLKIIIIN
jgi:hypothetical protein